MLTIEDLSIIKQLLARATLQYSEAHIGVILNQRIEAHIAELQKPQQPPQEARANG